MDLISYLGLKVKIVLANGYYYVGKVICAEESSIDIIDMNNKKVSLRKEAILTIQEISKC